jgi:TRAP-type C4-dicarboxylate transport system substrate-binding protein
LQHPGNFNKAIRSPNHEETQMKKLFAKTLIAASLAGSAFVAQAQEVTLKVHHFLSPTTFIHRRIRALVRQAGQGIQQPHQVPDLPGHATGWNAPTAFDQAKDGVADVVWTVLGYSANRFPMSEVFELPFTMTNAEATSRAAWEFTQTYGQHEFKDVQVLAAHVHGPGYLFTTKKQMKSMDDFKGMKFRAPTPLTNKMLAAWAPHRSACRCRRSRSLVQGRDRGRRDSLPGGPEHQGQ